MKGLSKETILEYTYLHSVCIFNTTDKISEYIIRD